MYCCAGITRCLWLCVLLRATWSCDIVEHAMILVLHSHVDTLGHTISQHLQGSTTVLLTRRDFMNTLSHHSAFFDSREMWYILVRSPALCYPTTSSITNACIMLLSFCRPLPRGACNNSTFCQATPGISLSVLSFGTYNPEIQLQISEPQIEGIWYLHSFQRSPLILFVSVGMY